MIIKITYDYTEQDSKSYLEGLELIKQNINFTTNCLEFFDFSFLKKADDDVVVIKSNNKQISLRNLLSNNYPYTDKFIRKEHDAKRLLLSGGLKFIDGNKDYGFITNFNSRNELSNALDYKFISLSGSDINYVDSIIDKIKELDISIGYDSSNIEYIKNLLKLDSFANDKRKVYIIFSSVKNGYRISYEIQTDRYVSESYINDQGYEDGGYTSRDVLKCCTEISLEDFLKIEFKNKFKITEIKTKINFKIETDPYYVYIENTAVTKDTERIKVKREEADKILNFLNNENNSCT